MIEAVVFSRPGCTPCASVKEKLTQAGIPFTDIDVFEDAEALAALKEAGYQAVPVVTAAITFQGDSDDAIEALKEFKDR